MKRYNYIIRINESPKYNKTYCYNYGLTKNIKISISIYGVSIEATMTRKYSEQEIFSPYNHLFVDALKKAFLIYLILYSKALKIETVKLKNDEQIKDVTELCRIYSIIDGGLSRQLSIGWIDNDVTKEILLQTKSSSRHLMAALFALICSKNKIKETERFIYLWMSLNGMYGFFSNLVGKVHDNTAIKNESIQIRYFQQLNDFGKFTIKEDKEKNRIAQSVIAIVKNYKKDINGTILKNDKEDICQEIRKILTSPYTGEQYNLTPYGYIITQLAYYYRCNLFHASKPVILFSFEGDLEIECLRKVNNILEEYIDINLCKWFNKDYRESYLVERAKKIEILKH